METDNQEGLVGRSQAAEEAIHSIATHMPAPPQFGQLFGNIPRKRVSSQLSTCKEDRGDRKRRVEVCGGSERSQIALHLVTDAFSRHTAWLNGHIYGEWMVVGHQSC